MLSKTRFDMSGTHSRKLKISEPYIDFKKIQDIIYWSKKWEVSPHQLIEASIATQNSSVKVIEEYLRNRGFAI
ncbi:MAG: hypothetical protein WKF89_01445 [Chitinophagaceae bacterium]